MRDFWKIMSITIIVSQSVLFEASAFLLQVSPAGSLQKQEWNKVDFKKIKNAEMKQYI